MKHGTGIEWTHMPGFKGETWNPVVGCSVLSPGCTNCYAMKMAGRLEAISVAHEAAHGGDPGPLAHYRGLLHDTRGGPVWNGKVAHAGQATLVKPLRWKKPRAVFVNSMGDLFHPDVPSAWIDQTFAVMALTPQHIYVVLTKRAERMRAYLNSGRAAPILDQSSLGHPAVDPLAEPGARVRIAWALHKMVAVREWHRGKVAWPLPNVWLGVSAEDQARAVERIPHLLATPAAVRILSAEPLLGPLVLEEAWHGENALDSECWGQCAWCEKGYPPLHNCQRGLGDWTRGRSGLDAVWCGGESGPGSRPMHPDWARDLRDQCATANVPFFFKQYGDWVPAQPGLEGRRVIMGGNGHVRAIGAESLYDDDVIMAHVGKKAAGALLDGVEHRAWPRAIAS